MGAVDRRNGGKGRPLWYYRRGALCIVIVGVVILPGKPSVFWRLNLAHVRIRDRILSLTLQIRCAA